MKQPTGGETRDSHLFSSSLHLFSHLPVHQLVEWRHLVIVTPGTLLTALKHSAIQRLRLVSRVLYRYSDDTAGAATCLFLEKTRAHWFLACFSSFFIVGPCPRVELKRTLVLMIQGNDHFLQHSGRLDDSSSSDFQDCIEKALQLQNTDIWAQVDFSKTHSHNVSSLIQ